MDSNSNCAVGMLGVSLEIPIFLLNLWHLGGDQEVGNAKFQFLFWHCFV